MDDPFTIPIRIFRHTGYQMPVNLQDAGGSPYLVEGYAFFLEIAAKQSDRSWASPPAFSQKLVAGSGATGTVFVLGENDTGKLDFHTPYEWRVLAQAPGGSAPSALVGGSCSVFDGPAMPPGVNPL